MRGPVRNFWKVKEVQDPLLISLRGRSCSSQREMLQCRNRCLEALGEFEEVIVLLPVTRSY